MQKQGTGFYTARERARADGWQFGGGGAAQALDDVTPIPGFLNLSGGAHGLRQPTRPPFSFQPARAKLALSLCVRVDDFHGGLEGIR